MSKVCKRCVMNQSVDPDIHFDELGVCNHCKRYENKFLSRVNFDENALTNLIKKIKKNGINRRYDVVVGVSGGVDSTYVCYLARKMGLRVLAVHVDNNWNSNLAVSNIENTLTKLDIPLKTVVLDWSEFSKVQKAFLLSNVPDGEIPTDHAIYASLWKIASELGIKTILSGMNFQTESISVPSWSYGHMDAKYIKSLCRENGHKINKKKFPLLSLAELAYYTFVKGIKSVSILNYIKYDKNQIKQVLKNELDWQPYEGKHFESEYTKFYQGIYLVNRFGIDKRCGHLSDLIYSGQLSRNEAIDMLKSSAVSIRESEKLINYVCRKLSLPFESLYPIDADLFNRDKYSSNKIFMGMVKDLVDFLRKANLYPK